MADNIQVKNASGVTETVRTTDNGGVHTPHQNAQLMVGGAAVSENNLIPATLNDMAVSMRAMLNVLSLMGISVNTSTGQLRVSVDAGTLPGVSTVTTCSTVTNLSQIGGNTANNLLADAMYNQYANAVRANIT